MDLSNYVALLLQTQQSVGVEGLGTFSNAYIAGAFDEAQDAFLPPRIQVAFQTEIENSTALEQFISDKMAVSIADAKTWIQNQVQKISLALDAEGHCDLSPLGTLYKNDSVLSFEAFIGEQSVNHTFFGLPTLEADESEFNFLEENTSSEDNEAVQIVTNLDQLNNTPEKEISSTAQLSSNDEASSTSNVTFDDEIHDEDEIVSKASGIWKWLLWIVVLALLSFVLYLFTQRPKWAQKWLPAQKENIDSNKLLLSRDILTDSVIEKEQSAWVDSNLVDSSKNDSSALKMKERANKYLEAPPSVVDTFQVIIASFPNRITAIKQLAIYKQKGLAAEVAYGAKGVRTKIALGTYTNLDSAIVQQKLMQNKGFKEAWILIKKAN